MIIQPWIGEGKKLDVYDIPKLGHQYNLSEDLIRTVLDVETLGTGFGKHGVIKLFEEHIFYKNLPTNELKNKAVAAGLAYPKWRRNYKNNHNTFLRAYKFHPEAALKACSWGLGQILGENYKSAGFSSPIAMVKTFAADEEYQLNAMMTFIKTNRLDDDLRRKDFPAFAGGYNGPAYKKNRYDVRLRQRYNYWQGRPDVKWSPELAKSEEKIAKEEIKTLEKAQVIKDSEEKLYPVQEVVVESVEKYSLIWIILSKLLTVTFKKRS